MSMCKRSAFLPPIDEPVFFVRYALSDVQNVANVAGVIASVAICAVFPLKWQADVREPGAELTFCVGGKLGHCH